MRTKREFFLALIFLTAVALTVTHPITRNIENWGIEEWDMEIVDIAIQVDTVLIFHQVPLWTPHKNGGTFVLAKPLSLFLSPFFLFPLLAGPVIGMKLSIIAHLIFGLLAMYALARHLGMGVMSSCCAAFLFFLNTRYALYLNEGNFEYMVQAFFPAVLLFYIRFLNEPAHRARYLFWGAVFCSLVFLDGGVYYYVYTFVLLAVFTFASLVTGRTGMVHGISGKRLAASFTVFVLLALAFSAVKLVPSLELQHTYPRVTKVRDGRDSGYPVKVLINALLTRTQKLRTEKGETRSIHPALAFKEGRFRNWEESGAYVGVMPLLLYLMALFFFFRKKRDLVLASLLFLLLSVTHIGPVNLWKYIHLLPIFNNMRCPARFIILFLFSLSLLVGHLLHRFEKRKWGRLLVLGCTLFILGDMIAVSRPLYESMFTTPPKGSTRSDTFFQTRHTEPREKYSAYLANTGVIRTYAQMSHPRKAIAAGEEGYRGEAYLLGPSGTSEITYFSPNRVVISVTPAGRDLLVLNQNYQNGWRVRGSATGRVMNHRGLAVTEVDDTTGEVEFYYRPLSFTIGLCITLLAYALFGVIFMRSPRKRTIAADTR